MIEMLRGVYPERREILRFAQNDILRLCQSELVETVKMKAGWISPVKVLGEKS